jgi:hypothetical protein
MAREPEGLADRGHVHMSNRSRVSRCGWALGICGALAGIAASALAQPPPAQGRKMFRARMQIPRQTAVSVLGNLRPVVPQKDMEAMDLDHASGLSAGWDCSVAIIPVKSDLLKFPGEKAPVFVVGLKEAIQGWGGPLVNLPPDTYVLVAEDGTDHADLYNFHRRAEPVAQTPMAKKDTGQQSETPKWYLQQRGAEIWYHLIVGGKDYSWALLLPPEKKEETKPAAPK